MITIHHLTSSRSERIVWLMQELGLEYRLDIHRREPTGAAPAAMRDLHPLGKAPIMTYGDLVPARRKRARCVRASPIAWRGC